MPEIFEIRGYSVSFNLHDGEHGVHVRIARGGNRDMAKFLLTEDADVVLGHNRAGMSAVEVRRLQRDLMRRYDEIVQVWDERFGGSHHCDR